MLGRWASRAALAVVLIVAAVASQTPASAQTYTVSLTLDPTEIPAADLDGATIKISPEHATFILAGGGSGNEGGRNAQQYIVVVASDFQGSDLKDAATPALSAAGLAEISLSGAPAGLTIASGRLLANERRVTRGVERPHRSAEITLAYTGSTLAADATVTLTVSKKLLSKGGGGGDGGGGIDVDSVSAQFTAQAAQGDGLSTVEVPEAWSLIPSGISAGETFRFLFVTTTKHPPTSTDIDDFNGFVQTAAAGSNIPAIAASSAHFRVVGSTAAVDARDNTETNVNEDGAGEPIYWLKGDKVADDYADFYDGTWDDAGYKNQNGATFSAFTWVLTGSKDDGTKSNFPLGHASASTQTQRPHIRGLQHGGTTSGSQRLFALSPVFRVADALPTVEVPADWALIPDGISAGDSFRLVFITPATLPDLTSGDIATYNTYVQNQAATASDQTIMDNSEHFRVLGSTNDVDARDNTETYPTDDGAGEKIYWLKGDKAADDYADLYDGSWDNGQYRDVNGVSVGASQYVYTGSIDNGTKDPPHHFGHSSGAAWTRNMHNNGLDAGGAAAPTNVRVLAMSPVFQVAAAQALPEVSIAGPGTDVAEGTSAVFTVSVDTAPTDAAGLTVLLHVDDAAAPRDFIYPSREGDKEVTIPMGATSVTHSIPILGDDVLEDAGDVTVSIRASASDYTIESGKGSATATVPLNDQKTVSFASSTYSVNEGDAVTLTVQLDSGTTSKDLLIQLQMHNVTANRNTDLTRHLFTATIPAGGSQGSVMVQTVADGIVEGDETFDAAIVPIRLTLDYDDGEVTLGSPGRATVTITEGASEPEEYEPPSFKIVELQPVGIAYVPESGGESTFEVWINQAAESSVEVPLRFSQPPANPLRPLPHETSGSAVRNTDYTVACVTPLPTGVTCALSGGSPKITFAAGAGGAANPVRVKITGVADSTDEGTELVSVNLSAVTGWDEQGGALFFITEEGVTLTPDRSDGGDWTRPGYDFALRLLEGDADDNEATYSLVLDNDPGETVTIAVASDDASVTVSPATITFTSGGSGNWGTAQPVTVTAADDSDSDAGAATITHTPTVADSDGRYHLIDVPTVTVSVLDDEAKSVVSISGGPDVDEGTAATFTVTFTPAPATNIPVSYNVFQIGDVIASSALGVQSVTIAAGTDSATITINTVGDSDKENDGTVLVSLTPPSPSAAYIIAPPTSGQVNVLDDDGDPDPPADPMTLSIVAGDDVVEGTAGQFTVKVTGDSGEHPVGYSADRGVRTLRSSYGPLKGGLLSNPSWRSHFVEGQRVVTLTANADSRDEPSDLVILDVYSRKNPSLPRVSDGLIIRDNDPTTVALARTDSGDIDEAGETATFTITLGRSLAAQPNRRSVLASEVLPVQLNMGGAATAGSDYTLSCAKAVGITCSGLNTANPVVTFTGQVGGGATARTATLTLTAIDDGFNEGSAESLTIELAPLSSSSGINLDGGASGSGGPFNLAITDDDSGAVPEISITAGTSPVNEGTAATFTVTATPPPSADLTVNVSVTESGSFIDGSAPTTVTIPTGGSVTLSVSTDDDKVDEPNGSVTATITNPSGYTISATQGAATVVVEDDDDAVSPEISITAGTSPVMEGAAATFTVTATPPPAADLTVNVSVTESGSFIDGTPPTTVTIPTGGSVTLSVSTDDDKVDEPNGSVTVTITNPSGYTISATQGAATVVVNDDDAAATPEVSVSANKSSITEGGSVTFTVTANPAPTAALTVKLDISEQGGQRVVPSGQADTHDLTIAAGATTATYTVTTRDDSNIEPTGTITAEVLAGTGYTLGDPSTLKVSIIENDAPPAYEVPANWAHLPSGLSTGDTFRVLFVTSTTRDATATDIGTYNTFVQTAAAGSSDQTIMDNSARFKVLGSTASDDAHDNTDSNPQDDGDGVPIYWLGGAKVADDYSGLYDGSWDSGASRDESGASKAINSANKAVFTGSDDDGTASSNPLGDSGNVQTAWGFGHKNGGLSRGSQSRTSNRSFLAMSPIFRVGASVDLPEVSISGPAGNTAEGASAVFTVTSSEAAPAGGLTVLLTVTDATAPRDFVASGDEGDQSVTIPANATSTTYSVPITQDTVLEDGGDITVNIRASASDYTIKSDEDSATASVALNDAVQVRFSSASYTVNEGSGPASATVQFVSGTSSRDVTVEVRVGVGTDTATATADFNATAQTVTIPAGMSSQAFTIPIVDDAIYEGNESFTLVIPAGSLPNGVTRSGDGRATANITDNDTPQISIAAGTSPVTEAAGANASFTLSSNIAIAKALSVSVTVADVTGSDFIASGNQGSQTVTFAVDTTSPYQYVYNVPIVNDTVDEASGDVTATVTSGAGYTVNSGANEATVTVQDDDQPVVSISGPSGNVAEGTNAAFTVTLEREQSTPITVLLHVDDAASPRDFVAATNEGDKSIPIPANTKSVTYNVPIVQDDVLEDAGAITVGIRASASDYTIKSGEGSATASVAQNDTKTVRFSSATYSVTEGGSAVASLVVELAEGGSSSKAIPVSVNLTDVTAVRGSDYTGAATRSATIAAGSTSATIQILAVDDAIDEPDQTYTAAIQTSGLPSGVTRSGSQNTATVTIVDNDTPTVSVTAVAASVTEGATNARARFQVSSDLALEHAVVVKLNVADVAGSNFIATGAEGNKNVTLPISATAPVTVEHSVVIQNDQIDEASGNVTGTLNRTGATSQYTVAASPNNVASVMVNDDDVPVIQIAADAGSVTEANGARTSFTLTSSLRTMQNIVVNVGIAEAAGSDFINNSNEGARTFTIAASPSATPTHTFTVPLINDGLDELNGSVTATLTAPPPAGRYTIAASPNNAATVTLVDDDVPEVTITAGTSPITEGTAASFTLSISPVPAVALTVSYTVADAPNADFVTSGNQGAKTANVNVGAGSRTITVATAGGSSETMDEPSGNVKVTLNSGSDYTVGSANMASVRVQDNDTTVVELDVSGGTPPALTEGGTRPVTLRLPRALYAGEGMTVPIINFTGAGNATRGTATPDYNLTCPSPLPTGFTCSSINTTGGSVTITGSAAGSATELAMTLSSVADNTNEPGGENINLGIGTITVPSGKNLDGGAGTWDNAPQFKLNDPPANPVNLSVTGGGLTVTEGQTRTIRATLGSANTSGSAISIPLVIGAGSTAQGADYTLSPLSISIANNATSGTRTFTAASGGGDEADETVIVELGSGLPSGIGQGTNNAVTLTIQDTNPTTVTLARTGSGAIIENGGTATLTVTLGRALAAGESLPVVLTLGGSATGGTDYSVACSGTSVSCSGSGTQPRTVTFTSGGQTATVTITATQDTVDEGASESVSVTLGALTSTSGTNLDGGATGSGGPITFNITDDDDPVVPVVTITRIGSGSITEGDSVTFRLAANPAPAANIVVNVNVADAPAPSDFLQPAQQGARTLTITAGTTTKNFTVQTHGDSADEPHGDIRASVNAGAGYTLGTVATRSATVQVQDDDGPPPVVVTISRLGSATITEGAQARFRLTSNPAPTVDITVNVTIADAAGSNFIDAGNEGSRPYTISSGATTRDITVQTHNDSTDEPNGNIRATVTAGTGYTIGSPSTITTRVNDNDNPPRPVITITGGGAVTEGTAAQFTVTASFAPSSNLAVSVTVAEVGGGDYVHASNERTRDITITRNTTSRTFTVHTEPDSVEEPAGRVRATVNARSVYALGSPRAATVDIWDDDAPTLVTISAVISDDAVIEGQPAQFRLHVSPPSSSPINVNVVTSDAGNGNVLTAGNTGSRQITVPANTERWTFGVPTDNDFQREPHGLVEAVVSTGAAYTPGDQDTAYVPVWNNDRGQTPQLLVSPNDVRVTERGYPAQYLIGLNTEPTGDVTVRLAPQGNTSAVAIEPRTLTFTPDDWRTPQVITVTALPDDNRFNERVTVWHQVSGYGRVQRGPSATIQVTDDGRGPRPGFYFFHSSSTAQEAIGTHLALISISPAPTQPVTLRYTLSGDAELGFDYDITGASGNAGEVMVQPGQRRILLPIKVIDDDEFERVEIIILTLLADADDEYTVNPAHNSHTVAIVSDDARPARPRAAFALDASQARESSPTHNVTVRLSPPAPQGGLTVNYEVAGGTATLGDDYTIVGLTNNQGTLQFSAGQTTATIALQVVNDSADEGAETVQLALQPERGVYELGRGRTHTVTLVDDIPRATFDSATSTAPERSATRSVRINLSPAPDVPVTLRYSIGGTAVDNTDYRIEGTDGQLNVQAGETQAHIRVQTLDDGKDDGDRTLVLTLLPRPGEYRLGGRATRTHTMTLQDDDVPVVFISALSPVHEGQSASFRLTSIPAPGSPITVNVTVSEVGVGDFLLSSEERTRQITIGTGTKTFTVPTHDDNIYEADGSIQVTVTGGSGYEVGGPSTATARVNDNDGRPNPTVTIEGGPAVTEGRTAGFTLRANPSPVFDLPVTVTIADAGGSDFVRDEDEGARTVVIPAGAASAAFTVRTRNDRDDEPNGDIRATVTGSSDYRLGTPASATVRVNDNDDPPPPPEGPTITITRTAQSVTEGQSARFTLTANPAPQQNLTVNVNVTQQGDFLRRAQGTYRVLITPSGTATFVAQTVDDDAQEPDGRIRVRILGGTGYTTGSPSAANIAVHDNDDAPPLPPPDAGITVTAASQTITEGETAVFYIRANPVPDPFAVNVRWHLEKRGGMNFGARSTRAGQAFGQIGDDDGLIVVEVATWNNFRDEADGTITLTLTGATGGIELGDPITVTVTVLDND